MLLTVTGKKMRWQLACICNLARIKKKRKSNSRESEFPIHFSSPFLKEIFTQVDYCRFPRRKLRENFHTKNVCKDLFLSTALRQLFLLVPIIAHELLRTMQISKFQ
jgi:hypothetical protein